MLKAFLRRLAGAPPRQPIPAQEPREPAAPKRQGSRPTPPAARPAPSRPGTSARRPPRQIPKPRSGRHLAYAPKLDGDADPGEIVWTWVPYEEDPNQGKDRPVLVVGRDGRTLLGLMLSSQGERDGQRHWLALGPGEWDSTSRPSWVRLDRVLEVEEDGIRREGAVLDRARFDRVAALLRRDYGWP
ncbi:type II toxin-antitoxin system PemK/MazF family toxin [Actinoplanes sp. GCM10030250]|uniref:type II toxin-antitoxin system PemK/MazF family toxin n=1 Tax=Actinoplanes sp. GCM10030250 TaxID=3273376 RepID=UPI003611B784